MTKHDPAEIEAVATSIRDAYNEYVEGTSSLENMGGHYTQWIHEPVYPDVLAKAAITALDAHRAPAIRAAMTALIADANALGVALARKQADASVLGVALAHSQSEHYIKKLRKHRAESERALLAICGIDEQENA